MNTVQNFSPNAFNRFISLPRFTMAAPQNGAQPKISPGQSLHRSISTPAQPTTSVRVGGLQQQQQQQVQMNPMVESQAHRGTGPAGGNNSRVGLSRSLSRTEAVKE